MKRLLALILFLTCIICGAQEPFFLYRPGAKLTFAINDAKGKPTGYSTLEVKSVNGTVENCTVTYESMVTDKKKTPLLTKPLIQEFTVKDNTVSYDAKSLAGQVMEGMKVSISGTPFRIPAGVKVGDTFGDYNVTINIAGIKTTTGVTGIKVTAAETLIVDGRSIECIVIEQTTTTQVFGMKQTGTQKTWYGRGYGNVRTDAINSKGKTISSNVLVEID